MSVLQMLVLEKLSSQFIERNVQQEFGLFHNTAFLREKLELNICKEVTVHTCSLLQMGF